MKEETIIKLMPAMLLVFGVLIYVGLRGADISLPVTINDEKVSIKIPGPKSSERKNRPDEPELRTKQPVPESASVERPKRVPVSPPQPPEDTYTLVGNNATRTTSGIFADVIMPGLTPGAQVKFVLLPGGSQEYISHESPMHYTFTVGPSGRIHVYLPRFVTDLERGKRYDLQNEIYWFYYDTNDHRFPNCGMRSVRMPAGRKNFTFLPADRVFCRDDDDGY